MGAVEEDDDTDDVSRQERLETLAALAAAAEEERTQAALARSRARVLETVSEYERELSRGRDLDPSSRGERERPQAQGASRATSLDQEGEAKGESCTTSLDQEEGAATCPWPAPALRTIGWARAPLPTPALRASSSSSSPSGDAKRDVDAGADGILRLESSARSPGQVAEEGEEDQAAGTRICRFCFVGEDDENPTPLLTSGHASATSHAVDQLLVSPCSCSGTQKWIHVGCLRQWQRVSMSTNGTMEARCRVCHQRFRLPRAPLRECMRHWFALTAKDRVLQYTRVWWQILSNSIMAQEGTSPLTNPTQVGRLVLATEVRIWGLREVRGGNMFLRKLQQGARWCTNVHSVILLFWLFSVGAVNVGDSLAYPGGPLDHIIHARHRPAWHCAIAKWAKAVVGRPLGWLLRVAVPASGGVMRIAEPVHGVITWVERYPQYRVM